MQHLFNDGTSYRAQAGVLEGTTVWLVPTGDGIHYHITDECYHNWRRAGYIQKSVWVDGNRDWLREVAQREGCRFAIQYPTHSHFIAGPEAS